MAKETFGIFDISVLNRKLYAVAPFPEADGKYRSANTLVLGAKFETTHYMDFPMKMKKLDEQVDAFLSKKRAKKSVFIEEAVRIHHQLTVIHAFNDGNGRTARAFVSMLF